jgi:hypothetical protein
MVEFNSAPIEGLAEIRPLPANVIPAMHLVRDKLQPESINSKPSGCRIKCGMTTLGLKSALFSTLPPGQHNWGN